MEDSSTDPATGGPLPPNAIQRVLFVGPRVHVYNIPPLTSTKGHTAAHWTAPDDRGNSRLIFTARARVLETAWEDDSRPEGDPARDRLKVDVVLEDPSSGQLFAAAPYTSSSVVEPVVDSSRFFAAWVQDPSAGRKAVLGIGFEDRSEAFDFGVAMQEARKSLGMDDASAAPDSGAAVSLSKSHGEEETKRDFSLREGETITVNLGGKFGRRRPQTQQQQREEESPTDLSAFALPPPPGPGSGGSGGGGGLPPPPPPSTSNARAQQREQKRRSAQDLGFDDGQFGEFA